MTYAIIYSDGSVDKVGNGGFAFVADVAGKLYYGGGWTPAPTTVNLMEMEAIKHPLSAVVSWWPDLTRIDVVSDSQYVVKGINHWYWKWINNDWKKTNGEDVANKVAWMGLMKVVRSIPMCNIEWRNRRTCLGLVYADDLAASYRIHRQHPDPKSTEWTLLPSV